MQIIPAVDIRDGRSALVPGVDTLTRIVNSEDPVEQAIIFRELGAQWIHVTDLDGSFSGRLCNMRLIQEMSELPGLKIEYSGGVRTKEQVDTLISMGVERVMLRASILRNKAITQQLFEQYGDRVIAGVDGRDGMVTIEGFATAVSTSVLNMVAEMRDMGMKQIAYTDLRRSGMMKGPNIEGIEQIISTSGMKVLIAGGVNNYDTIRLLKKLGAAGLIIGKAIYTGAIDFRNAQTIAAE